LTSISLSNVIRIGSGVFVNSPITSFSLPKIETIGHTAFYSAVLTGEFNFLSILTIGNSTFCQSHFQRINLPNATSLGVSIFYSSPVTLLNISKVLGLENGVFNTFWSIVNSSSTDVTISISSFSFNMLICLIISYLLSIVVIIGILFLSSKSAKYLKSFRDLSFLSKMA